MLKVQIKGAIPITKGEVSLTDVGQHMVTSVRMNFISGGRPIKWKPLAGGDTRTPLRATGALARSVRYLMENDFTVVIEAGRGVKSKKGYPYAGVHQFGAGPFNVPITKKSRKYFWFMFFRTGDEKWKYMALTPKQQFSVTIPARPYMVFQQSDIEFIRKNLITAIIVNAQRETINVTG